MTATSWFPTDGGVMGAAIRAHDWSDSPIGPPDRWPPALRSTVQLMLGCPRPMFLAWGPDLLCFYNDAYVPILGYRRDAALGRPFGEVWASIWREIEPLVTATLAGETQTITDMMLDLARDGKPERSWWSFTYSPAFDDDGAIAGLFCVTGETTAKVLSEAALRESEERLRLVVESARDHAILTTDPSGTITTWSAGAEATLGWTAVEAEGRPIAVIFTPEDRDAGVHEAELATAAATGYASDERWHVTKAGTAVYMSGSVHPLARDAGGAERGFLKIARDQTDRQHAASRMRLEIERQRLSLQQMPGFAAILSGPQHVFDYVNDAYVEVAGVRDYVGRPVRDVFPDLAGQGFFGLLDGVYATGEPFSRRAMPIRLAGEDQERFIDLLYQPIRGDDGAVTGIFAGGYDVTERVRAEGALAESEERLRLATEAAEVGFWDVDPVANTLVWPPSVKAMFGISAHVPVSMADFYAGLHPDDLEATSRAFALAADPAIRGLYDVEYRTIGQEDGIVRWVAAKGRGVFDDEGRCVRLLGTAIDVTQRKRDEERLRDLNDNLERRVEEEVSERAKIEAALRQAQKMEAVGQLTGGLAHDFNNLLAGISGSLELMGTRIAQGRVKDIDRYMAAAQGAARRAAALTHRLLAFSRRQTLDPKPTDVNALVAGMEELVRRTVGPAIGMEVVGAAGLWPALVDPPQLENALLNLCINARDAMPDGGRITIETANRWLDEPTGRRHDMPAGQYLSLCVTDTGTGMSPDVIAKAFDPFFTTKPIGEGTGLGLSMIYGFAKQSGGQVRIHSQVGQGTTVCIYLPRFHGPESEPDPLVALSDAPRTGRGETVLVVDDEPTVRMLVTDVLEDLGYTAIEAADSVSGLRVLQSDARLDLLITDVGLPGGMNGRQMADAGRVSRPDLKVLFITGYAENAVLGGGQLEPGMAVLTKPFVVETLGIRIREMIAAG